MAVVDRIIDRVAAECNNAIKDSGKYSRAIHIKRFCHLAHNPGLDPIVIEDIEIPFSLDAMAGVCGDKIPFLGVLCACLNKAK